MLLVLVLGGWLGWRVHLARRQREAVAVIKAGGGDVGYDWEFVGDERHYVAGPPVPAWLRRTIGEEYFQDVVEANLAYTDSVFDRWYNWKLTGDVVPTLRSFPRLRFLHLNGSQATDRTMDVVAGLNDLEELTMDNARVTDAGIAKLKGLKKLRALRIETDSGKLPIGDTGMAHLKSLTRLEHLILGEAEITDAGLAELKGLASLKELCIGANRVTREGMQRFRREMPKVEVTWENKDQEPRDGF
jgi:hypothetical protein